MDVSNDPLYPFGYGLSYSDFSYSEVKLDKSRARGNETVTASVTVTNRSNVDGKEVVQLYLRAMVGSITRPVKELKGFKKLLVKAGQSTTVSFALTPEDLKFYNSELTYDWEPGEFVVMIGGNSRDVKSAKLRWDR